eukprot:6478156-Amphidinium_carterae.3
MSRKKFEKRNGQEEKNILSLRNLQIENFVAFCREFLRVPRTNSSWLFSEARPHEPTTQAPRRNNSLDAE